MYAAAFQPEYEYITQISDDPNAVLITNGQSARCGAKLTGCAGTATNPTTMKARISSTVITVVVAWKPPVKRTLRRCAAVASSTSRSAAACSVLFGTRLASSGNAPQKYLPNAIALMAIGAAKPTVAEVSPVQKPTHG